MTLHLIRLDPNPHAAARWFAAEKLLPRTGEDDGYAWHALLSAVFGKANAPKPFRLVARRGRALQLLAYTGRDPAALRQAALDFADPVALAAVGLGDGATLAAKPLLSFAPGRRLGFSLRVRPTVRTDRDGERAKSAEIDAYVAAMRATPDALPDRKAVYADWTRARLEAGGTSVLDLRFDGLDQIPVLRKSGAGSDGVRRATLVQGHAASLAGLLEVTDAGAFAALLARGVGRHRAFGYGMLLLSPP
ncbi:MAG: type I-E CRISPR-associated protein Cas6/Cse3/CasE [Rhizobiaceae bacterium]|nr:type I-E CRISPR-associated protein Cas6/Cse3/CasE [Rhizobiaceae bacterium]